MPDELADLLVGLDPWVQFFLSIAALFAVLAAIAKWVVPRYRNAKSDARAIRDTLVGREAIRDSITGEEVKPAIPGIGSRVSSIEKQGETTSEQLGILTRAVADMAAGQERIDRLEDRVTAIEQGHFLERMAGKAESIQLFRTIEQVNKSADDNPADPHD